MARELQDLCHSGSRRPRQAWTRLLACRKPRLEADGVAEPSGAVSYERRIRVRPTSRGDGRERVLAARGPADQEATPRATVVSGRRRKADHFSTCAMSGTVGPPGSGSDYNHYEVSVTVANPRAVFGRDAIDMIGFDTVDRYKCAPGVARGATGSILAFPRSIQGRSGRNRGRSPRSGHLFEQRRYATSEPAGI